MLGRPVVMDAGLLMPKFSWHTIVEGEGGGGGGACEGRRVTLARQRAGRQQPCPRPVICNAQKL